MNDLPCHTRGEHLYENRTQYDKKNKKEKKRKICQTCINKICIYLCIIIVIHFIMKHGKDCGAYT